VATIIATKAFKPTTTRARNPRLDVDRSFIKEVPINPTHSNNQANGLPATAPTTPQA